MSLPGVVVSADWLAAHRADVVVADVRWYLDGRSGRAAYEAGHIAGAVFVDLDADLSEHGDDATRGRHPFPSPEHFAAAMAAHGIGDDTPVVAYDDASGTQAGRLVFMLRAVGTPAALLDGGLAAWTGPHEVGPAAAAPTPASRTVRPWPADRFATVAEVEAVGAGTAPAATRLLDARAAERYEGKVEPVDPRAGHIPGARNLPIGRVLDPATGRFADPATLRQRFAEVGVTSGDQVVASCGSGVSACILLAALHHAGLGDGRLFVPSFSGWSSDPDRRVATGTEP